MKKYRILYYILFGVILFSLVMFFVGVSALLKDSSPPVAYSDEGNYVWDGADIAEGEYEKVMPDEMAEEKLIQITTAHQLVALNILMTEGVSYEGYTVELMYDFDLTGYEWQVADPCVTTYFCLDGNEHTVKGFTCLSAGNYAGMFYLTAPSGSIVIRDLTVSGVSISGACAGVINCCEDACNVWIENCSVENSTIAGQGTAGGIAASLGSGSSLTACSVYRLTMENAGAADYNSTTGGLVASMTDGYIYSGTVSSCTLYTSSLYRNNLTGAIAGSMTGGWLDGVFVIGNVYLKEDGVSVLTLVEEGNLNQLLGYNYDDREIYADIKFGNS